MTTPHLQTARYLPSVDGLRTIAVFSVFFYHLSPSLLKGGFVGVDIFFVISGYLITNIIKSAVEANCFSFSQFYIRRIKRLFPAFAVVLLACTLTAYLLLNPIQIMEYARSGLAAVTSVSNIYFVFNSGYFAPMAENQVLLHTWSLSVEEQFYLVWPLLTLLIITQIPGRLQARFILLLTMACMIVCIYVGYRNSVFAFYLTPFRVAEFAIGGILCWYKATRHRQIVYELGTVTGLVLIVLSVFFINANIVFPGWVVFIPCIGTALVIYFSAQSKLSKALIGNSVMAYLGRISYPLYLVHWPLIVYAKIFYENELTGEHKIAILCIAMLSAAAIYHFIEKPIKSDDTFWKSPKRIAGVFAGCVSLFLVFFMQMHHFKGLPGQVSPDVRAFIDTINTQKDRRFAIKDVICVKTKSNPCEIQPGSDKRVTITGDSHGPDALNALHPYYEGADYSLQNLVSCPPLSLEDMKELIKPSHVVYEDCLAHLQKLNSSGFYSGTDYLVISVLFSNWYTPDLLDNFLSAVPFPENMKILVLGNAPSFTRDLPQLIIEMNSMGMLNQQSHLLQSDWVWKYEDQIKSVANKHGVKFISKVDFFCDSEDKTCNVAYGESATLLTYDKHHLSFEAAQLFGKSLKKSNPTLDELFDISN